MHLQKNEQHFSYHFLMHVLRLYMKYTVLGVLKQGRVEKTFGCNLSAVDTKVFLTVKVVL